ncbi:MAG TPA: hypothetical protein VFE22_03420 [Edaphobacter sp.]|nr:hypothetical protein [Edaphobacter sp.]
MATSDSQAAQQPPLLPLLTAAVAYGLFAALMWLILTQPCSWHAQLSASSPACTSAGPDYLYPVAALVALAIGVVTSRLLNRWMPFFIALGVTLLPLAIATVGLLIWA